MNRHTDGDARSDLSDGRLAELADKIVAVSLALRPLCSDAHSLTREARHIVGQSCEILSSVSTELVDMVGDMRPPLDQDEDRSDAARR